MAETSMTGMPVRGQRFALVDLVRGMAIAGVVFYHFCWDLGFFRYMATDVASDPLWRSFARLLAGTFLALVGVSLVLAHHRGMRWRAFWRRVGVLVLAAASISLATWFVFPQAFVFFGILHAIALFSVLALPFLRAPVWLTAAVAAVVVLLPLWLAVPGFESRWLAWIGLVPQVPPTNDYEPLFPWFGVTLFGIVLARLVLGSAAAGPIAAVGASSFPARQLAAIGRWTLVIYLVHQPVLFGVLYAVSAVFPASPEMERAAFQRSCADNCRSTGGAAGMCENVCACSADAFDREGLWPLLRSAEITNAERDRLSRITEQCFLRIQGAPAAPRFDDSGSR